MKNIDDAVSRIQAAWPSIIEECCKVLGSELHYQAMIYHCLRASGRVPADQIGMNVKMWISSPVTDLFKQLDAKKHKNFQGGFEPIPDVCLFNTNVGGDWRRRNAVNTLSSLLVAIEVKASERKGGRLSPREIIGDIEKLAAHRDEDRFRNSDFLPVMMVIDTAPKDTERMTAQGLDTSEKAAKEHGVEFLYASKTRQSTH